MNDKICCICWNEDITHCSFIYDFAGSAHDQIYFCKKCYKNNRERGKNVFEYDKVKWKYVCRECGVGQDKGSWHENKCGTWDWICQECEKELAIIR